jgi:hypothetical protein
MGRLVLVWAATLAMACVQPTPPDPERTAQRSTEEGGRERSADYFVERTYLTPTLDDHDGTPGFLHVGPQDMPLVVAIGFPPTPPLRGSRREARDVAIEAMRSWEGPIQAALPWFRLEFVEEDPAAAVQVEWKRRMTGGAAGRGTLRYWVSPEGLRVGGKMWVSITPYLEVRMTLDALELLIVHEFGHVLGLGHCLDCDSAMSYEWETQDRIYVTELDVRTFLALVAQPSGRRVDGRSFSFLPEDALPPLTQTPEP